MTSTIAIRNIYVMMAYAFRTIRADGVKSVSTESFDHLHDLLAEILVRGLGAQVKRGLHHDYTVHNDSLTTVRGRINVTRTVATRSNLRGKLVCEFDEYDPNTAHNQAVKSVIILLIRHGDVTPTRRKALQRLLQYLDAVAMVDPASIPWNKITYHRANATYRMLLGVCELIVRDLLPTQESGNTKLSSWVSDDTMSTLYERFIREYYAYHFPELVPKALGINWDYDTNSALGVEQLPAMRTDITLQREDRRLIIDAKYYGKSLQVGRWGKETVYSANLYQLFTYVKNADVSRAGSVSGLLLYASTTSSSKPNLDVILQGNRIGAHTLDLNQPWTKLATQLDDMVRWLDN